MVKSRDYQDVYVEERYLDRGAEKPQIKKLTAKNQKTGRESDLAGGLVDFRYYESILSNFITARLIVADTGSSVPVDGELKNVLDGLPIRGGENVDLNMLDPEGNQIKLVGSTGGDGLYVNRVKEGLTSEDMQKTITVYDLCTKEFFANEQTRVPGRYSGKISESVRKILKDRLKTDKNLDIEETSNSYNFIGNDKKPFYTVSWLMTKCIPADGAYGKTAGFLFFETKEGFKFKSLETLIGPTQGGGSSNKKKAKKFQYTGRDSTKRNFKKIINYKINKNIDVQEKLAIGAYNNTTTFFNPYDFTIKSKDFSMSEDQVGKVKSAGTDIAFVAKEFRMGPTRGMSAVLDMGTLPIGKDAKEQVENWNKDKENLNDKVRERMSQAITRYNQVFSVSLDVLIEGDFSLKAGDTIYCEFPDVSSKKKVSKETSGLYLIASLCHKVAGGKAFTSLNLIRDSFGKKGLK